jgi:hypothetical protein
MWLHALASQRRGDVNRIDAAAEADRATVGAGALQPPGRPADLIDIDGLTPQQRARSMVGRAGRCGSRGMGYGRQGWRHSSPRMGSRPAQRPGSPYFRAIVP